MSLRLLVVLGLSICPFLLACGGDGNRATTAVEEAAGEAGDAGEAIPVSLARVVREPLSSVYATSTTLRAEKRATVIARTRGVIRRLVVEEGAFVQSGQHLALLEDDEQRIALERAKTTRENRVREYERMRQLHSQALVSDEQHETARREAEDAEHAADLAELELSRTVIRAPFSGLILTRHLDPGATVADGTAVYDLADVTPLYADISVPERHVARLAPGQVVNLVADASNTEVAARIERIAPAVDPASGTVKVTVTAEAAPGLRPGAFVRVAIVTDTHQNARVVPRAALVAEGRRWNLFRLNEDGTTVEQLEVALGFEEGDQVEIAEVVSGGELAAGERVVVLGASALTAGARVEVVEPETEAGGSEEAPAADADAPGR